MPPESYASIYIQIFNVQFLTYKPVSYTHLDVYKRQTLPLAFSIFNYTIQFSQAFNTPERKILLIYGSQLP